MTDRPSSARPPSPGPSAPARPTGHPPGQAVLELALAAPLLLGLAILALVATDMLRMKLTSIHAAREAARLLAVEPSSEASARRLAARILGGSPGLAAAAAGVRATLDVWEVSYASQIFNCRVVVRTGYRLEPQGLLRLLTREPIPISARATYLRKASGALVVEACP